MSSTSDESDGELTKIPIQKKKTKPAENKVSPVQQKLTTKLMVNEALIELHTRKGVSLYAIKKYLEAKFQVDTERNGYYIKKYLKMATEIGTIVQTKGIGASGSFKLVTKKEKKKTEKKVKEKTNEEKPVKPKKSKLKKENGEETKVKKIKEKSTKEKPVTGKVKLNKQAKKDASKETAKVAKTNHEKKGGTIKKTILKNKSEELTETPVKKKTSMLKRRSIGNVIKPPKMKPKAMPKQKN